MDSLVNDHRFSRAFTDPRFKPMPTLQKKVKIDKRFKAVLSSKDYGHRVVLDKRGRPIYDVAKRGKHEMERYYQISSDDSSSDSDGDEEEEDEVEATQDSQAQVSNNKKNNCADSDSFEAKPKLKKKTKDLKLIKDSGQKKKRTDPDEEEQILKRKSKTDKKISNKKRSVDEEDDRFQVKRLKTIESAASDKKKSSIKKKYVEDDEDEERTSQRRSKKMEEQVSDDEGDSGEDIDDDEESSSDGDESSSDEDEDSGEEDVEEELDERTEYITVMKPSVSVDHSWNELHRRAPIVSDSTHRLAVCNMDWDFVKAQDLFVLFKSFAGEGGAVRSVKIYPSEFGKERMAEDAALGPREMRGNINGADNQSESEESEPEDQKRKKKKNRKIDSEIMKRKAKEAAKSENEALRGYQLNRLRYYFAVVDCNSVEAADTVYKECDGMEYQLSSIRIDLRFIPDDMTFDDPPKDSFSDEQGLVDFQPNYFHSTALSQGKVNVTWDETDFDRIRNKITNAQRDELEQIVEENRYADTIAPPESDSENGDDDRPQWLKTALGLDNSDDDGVAEEISEEKKISLYRKVLMDKLVEDKEKEVKATEIDKELEWTAGLKTAYESKLRRSEKIKEESQGVVVDKYLERKREKRRNRLQKKTELSKAEGDGSDEEHNVDDMPDIIDDSLKEMMESEGHDVKSLKTNKKKKSDKKKASKEIENDSEAEREKAELELLLMRDDDLDRKVPKPEKVKEKLSRRQKKKLSIQKSEKRKQRREGRLTLDVEDQRFGAMFTSHHFHIDPNHGQFRKTKNNMKLLDEQIKRMSTKSNKEKLGKHVIENIESNEDSRSVSKELVASLKRKMKK